jgi:transcriptional regulator with XRE-family HTH domain
MSLKENFRHNLRRVIEERGVSQRNLAEVAGVHFTFVSDILTGKSCPTLDVFEKLVRAVDIPHEMLLLDPRDFREWAASDFAV